MLRRNWCASALAAPLLLLGRSGPAAAQGSVTPDDRGGPPPALGTPLALPEAPLLDGGRFVPQQAQGRVLVLYWWASWCPFCALQTPHMEALWRSARPRGLQMLGLSIDKRPEDASAYLARRGYTFPNTLFTPAMGAVLPKPRGLPVTVVRGRDGRVAMAEAGQLFPEDVEGIARLL